MISEPPEVIGKVITILQEFLALEGDLSAKGSLDFSEAAVRGGEKHKGDEPPYILVGYNAISDYPFGPGSSGIAVADHTLAVRCYGRLGVASGEREAVRLSGLVRWALHGHAPVVMGTVAIYRIRVLSVGAALRDPVEDTPFVPMTIGLYAAPVGAAS